MYTLTSWNGANPETIENYENAFNRALERAKIEGKIIKLNDIFCQEVCSIAPDGTSSKWQTNAPYTLKDADNDYYDTIDEE